MDKKTSREAAINASDKLSKNLAHLAMLGDLLSASGDTLAAETIPAVGNTIWQFADEAKKAMTILDDRSGDLEKLNPENMLGPNVVPLEPKGRAS